MKNKIVSIHQPNYIPWIGYFYKIHLSDIFVFLDDVQYSNTGMHNYHYIKTQQGSFRLKIPVNYNYGDTINKVKIRNDLPWKQKHLKTIETNYRKSNFFNLIYNDFKEILLEKETSLAKLNVRIIKHITKKLGISIDFINSSDLKTDASREEKIIQICNKINCQTYYSGIGAKSYQNETTFINNGINLVYTEFHPFVYNQLYGNFIHNVSILDYLMNCGYDWDRVIKSMNSEKK